MTNYAPGRCPLLAAVVCCALILSATTARADGDLTHVNHIIIAMQENHSFDNYFGVLAFVPGSPYHSARGVGGMRACDASDHSCVDGLSCRTFATGEMRCGNSNRSNERGRVKAFHDPRYCTGPDLDHSWDGTHREENFRFPNKTFKAALHNGFVRLNAQTELPNQATDHDTMGYYTDVDLPFYYYLAETFAISDRYFAPVLGQTFPNRSYEVAGTSFGHLTTSEILTAGGYKPITGTIYDLLDANSITWTDYYSDLPYTTSFASASNPANRKLVAQFFVDAAAGTLPAVSFIDPSSFPSQSINGHLYETDEHPPNDIRAGEYFVSTIITALRNSPNWSDSILFFTYDEHGGFYDHAVPPPAPQGGASTPDGIAPGQCADLSNPPASELPGGGANCTHSKTQDAPGICPSFTPTGPYPSDCPTFNQLGVRLPFVAVSPFAKPHYVSHAVGDHTSMLALIEKRFLNSAHLTARDQNANTLEDMFNFDTSPSAATTIPAAPLPQVMDPGCPF